MRETGLQARISYFSKRNRAMPVGAWAGVAPHRHGTPKMHRHSASVSHSVSCQMPEPRGSTHESRLFVLTHIQQMVSWPNQSRCSWFVRATCLYKRLGGNSQGVDRHQDTVLMSPVWMPHTDSRPCHVRLDVVQNSCLKGLSQ
jgi:hypothetical protein